MKNKLLILIALLMALLACGVPAESLTPISMPTYYPWETYTPEPTVITGTKTMLPLFASPYPTQEIGRIVGSWNVRSEPAEGALWLDDVEDVFVQVIYRADGWVLIEYPCENFICYGWVHRDAFGGTNGQEY